MKQIRLEINKITEESLLFIDFKFIPGREHYIIMFLVIYLNLNYLIKIEKIDNR